MLDFLTHWLKRIFGTRNERVVRRLRVVAEQANALEAGVRDLSDDQLRGRTQHLRERIAGGATLEDILPEAFAVCREAGRRFNKMRHFDSQFIGGQVLHSGAIAEMATGEGKTLVATLPCYLNALAGRKVHLWSVNDYLVKRDRDWMAPILEGLGLTTGAIQSQMGSWGQGAQSRQAAYACDITYGTNSELGFDYLRDNMKVRLEDQVQGRRDLAIVDEADSILIDEARTPLIISGVASDDTARYAQSDEVARKLIAAHKPYQDAKTRRDAAERAQVKAEADIAEARRKSNKAAEDKARKAAEDAQKVMEAADLELASRTAYYEVEVDRHTVRMTHEGIAEAQRAAGVGSFYVGANMEWPHLMEQSLKAHLLYHRDKNYAVQDGEVKIVDEFTGRILEGRQWSDGLHQAVEAKERVKIKDETQTLATITIQNFARLYNRLAGMTGTAMTESEELMKIYGVDVVAIPTNRPVNRQDQADLIYQAQNDKQEAIVREVHEVHRLGRPDHAVFVYNGLKAVAKAVGELANRGPQAPPPPPRAAWEANGAGLDKDTPTWQSLRDRLAEMIGQLDAVEYPDDKTIEAAAALLDGCLGDLLHGRPVLVGTTSIEKSETLSTALKRRHGVDHQVLNAKPENARRESEIVAEAGRIRPVEHGPRKGQLWGTVTIATNMAGRGTDIKLAEGVVHPACKGDLGGVSNPDYKGPPPGGRMGLAMWREPGITGTKCCINCGDYDPATNCAHCFKPRADGRFPHYGRHVCPVINPCGLHIVGTERHESRRIDNQLRGRAGRQGDPGSSQFFLSLDDELLKIFMPEWTLTALKWMGLREGEPIQDRRVTRGIERAQKKVEERHFNSRKHLLEYDEVNNEQRKIFYGRRQAVLEGRDLTRIIREMIDEVVDEAVADHYSATFHGRCVAEWAKTTLRVPVDEHAIVPGMTLAEVEAVVRTAAAERARDEDIMRGALEFMDEEEDPKRWDLGALIKWAQNLFGAEMPSKQKLIGQPREAILELIETAAIEAAAKIDVTPAMTFLASDYHTDLLVKWANEKFNLGLQAKALSGQTAQAARATLAAKLDDAWQRREREEPLRHALGHFEHLGYQTPEAAAFLSNWLADRYKVSRSPESFVGRRGRELLPELARIAEPWVKGQQLETFVDEALTRHLRGAGSAGAKALAEWVEAQFGYELSDQEIAGLTDPPTPQTRALLIKLGQRHLRQELARLEQRMMLDTYDRAWKDHLYNLDFLKENVGLQGYGERDPKNVYKKEGFAMFQQTLGIIRDRVASRIFKLEVTDDVEEARGIYQITAAIHEEYAGFEMQQQQAMSAASAAGGGTATIAPIVIEGPKLGRNDVCYCGSGKKFKKCHGRSAKV